ncbi:hypothetical protein JYT26_00165 [Beggiatoa alba]|nr:hypothetical protein [Beggiatoa alba]
MTGAVFWICQILFFTVGTGQLQGETLLNWVGEFMGANANHSPVLQSAVGSLLTVFGLIGIFVTGLILDMIGSIFFMQEMRIFGRHIHRNQDWLDGMTRQCSSAVSEDYRDFQSEFNDTALPAKQKVLRLFRTSFHYQRFKLRFHYRHLQTFLLAYIHVYSANGSSEQLMDHVHVWRTARAISTALFIVAIEVISFESLFHKETEAVHPDEISMLFIHLVLFGLSAMLTLKSYNRMCFSLFTLACATNSHQPSTP